MASLLGVAFVEGTPNSTSSPRDSGRDPASATAQGAPQALSSNPQRRAAQLLESRVACLGCHRLDGNGGTIGPSLDDVGERLPPDFIRRMIADPQSAVQGSRMPAQPLSDRDVELLTEFLVSRGSGWSGEEPSVFPPGETTDDDRSGSALYLLHCASCHGVEGRGDGWNAPSLPVPPTSHADASLMERRVDDALYDAIHAGGWVLGRSPRMPAFGALLTPDEIRSLVAYIRTLCECTGPAWSTDGSGVSLGSDSPPGSQETGSFGR